MHCIVKGGVEYWTDTLKCVLFCITYLFLMRLQKIRNVDISVQFIEDIFILSTLAILKRTRNRSCGPQDYANARVGDTFYKSKLVVIFHG